MTHGHRYSDDDLVNPAFSEKTRKGWREHNKRLDSFNTYVRNRDKIARAAKKKRCGVLRKAIAGRPLSEKDIAVLLAILALEEIR